MDSKSWRIRQVAAIELVGGEGVQIARVGNFVRIAGAAEGPLEMSDGGI